MNKTSSKSILAQCEKEGIRLTEQRRTIVSVLEMAKDHPSTQELYEMANTIDKNISIATVYRTLNLLVKLDFIEKLEFGDGIARYEVANRDHHDHLIDVDTGDVIEFVDDDIERLQKKIAKRLGYRLCGHRMELYGVALNND
ncbi:MAG: Fur family transcriptional regulator [Rhodobacteraceae bacterium]|nr:Fur family transcriptional regulator [Paracoccaceae bacterium]